MTATASTPHLGYGSKSYRAYVLGMLVVMYTINAIDRGLLGLVQEKIKVDLHLSDFQLGLLGGPAFALLYCLAGIPIARLAERSNRITIVAVGAAAWSAATAACGFAGNFVQLALARVLVGIGESACVPPSHSALSDIFPSDRRASALGIYGVSVSMGVIAAAFGGGWLVQHVSWRMAFWVLGAPGILAALVLKLTVKDPPRSGPPVQTPSFLDALKTLAAKPSYRHVVLGASIMGMFSYGMGQFFASYLVRRYGFPLSSAGYALGFFGIFSAVGTYLSGYLCDRLAHRFPTILCWLPAFGLIASAIIYAVVFLQSSAAVGVPLLVVVPVFQLLWFSPLDTVTQNVAPPKMRATASAITHTFFNLIGYGLGPPIIGALADHFTKGRLAELGVAGEACKRSPHLASCAAAGSYGLNAALLTATVFLVWGAVHFWLAGRTLRRDSVD